MDVILVTSCLGFWFPDPPQPPPYRSIFPSFFYHSMHLLLAGIGLMRWILSLSLSLSWDRGRIWLFWLVCRVASSFFIWICMHVIALSLFLPLSLWTCPCSQFRFKIIRSFLWYLELWHRLLDHERISFQNRSWNCHPMELLRTTGCARARSGCG